jgi:hypothetical protein
MPGDGWPDLGLSSAPGEGGKSIPAVNAARALVGVNGVVGLVGEWRGAVTVFGVIVVGEACELDMEAAIKALR